MLPANYFDAATALRERLLQELPQMRSVRTASGLAEVAHLTPDAPALILCWDGDAGMQDNGCLVTVEQRWIVAVAVRSARDTAGGSGVIEAAGPLFSAVLAALAGWKPDLPGAGRLRRVEAPRPGFDAGYGLFPLAFLLRRTFTVEQAA